LAYDLEAQSLWCVFSDAVNEMIQAAASEERPWLAHILKRITPGLPYASAGCGASRMRFSSCAGNTDCIAVIDCRDRRRCPTAVPT
jgi:hypothetical protein